MKITPSDNFVVIKPILSEYKLENGIIITNPRQKVKEGKVIDFGKNVTGLKKGDEVAFIPMHAIEVDGFLLVDGSESEGKILYKKQ